MDLRADESIRRIATARNDVKMLAVVSRDLVAAEGCYHRSCYKAYTWQKESSTYTSSVTSENEESYARVECAAYQMLFDHVRTHILETPKLVTLTDLTRMMLGFMQDLGVGEAKESTKTHLRRKLEAEFGSMLQFENLLGNNTLFVIPGTLSRLQLAKDLAKVLQQQQSEFKESNTEDIRRVALELRKAICSNVNERSWPPKTSELTEDGINIPNEVRLFLSTLLSGGAHYPEEPCSSKVQRLVNSFGQDLVFGVTGGRQNPPKHLLLPYTVKTLTNNVDVIRFLNQCGHGITYSQIEEMNTVLCLQKLAMTPENTIQLPDNIKPYVSTSLAWDNIDRLEETLSGGGTSHRVNGIAIQALQYGPDLPPVQKTPTVTKSKQRSVEVVGNNELAIYNAGERCGPPRRSYVEITSSEIETNAWKKNRLRILVSLHAAEKQTVCGWTGFNILVRSETDVSQDNIGYLPTIDAPATNMSTVFEVLRQSVQIKGSLKLKSIVVVFDQALYAKAADIKWKHSERFKSVVLGLGGFHTIVTFLGIFGKRFQDAGLRDICTV